MGKKVLLTATVLSHIVQFHRPLADMLHTHGFEVHVAARNNLSEKDGILCDFADKIFEIPFSRSPISRTNVDAYKALKRILADTDYDVIHCNTPMGGAVTRLAARDARKRGAKIIYTAHGFHFYKGAPVKNWLIYYPIEKILAKHTDILITITEEDFNFAKNKRFKTNVARIHSVGCNLERFRVHSPDESLTMRESKGFGTDDMIALCVGELNDNKNQITLLHALPKIVSEVSNFRLLLVGNGPNFNQLLDVIKQLNMENHAHLLGYRKNIEEYYCICDMVVSASRREGLPMNILEAMACGKPVIASRNRGHNELVEDGVTGFLLSASDADGFAGKMIKLAKDPALRIQMGQAGREKAVQYALPVVESELEDIYFNSLSQ